MTSPNERRREYLSSIDSRETVYICENVFSDDERKRIVLAMERADLISQGFRGDRHQDFPTYDMPAYELSARAFAFVRKLVRERVFTTFANANGLDPADLFFKDLFFVKYATANNGQSELALHRDGSLFSFNILLNDPSEFTGGGTFFPEIGPVQINQGDCVMHDGKVLHAGAKLFSGQRIILVGFIDSVISEEVSYGYSKQSAIARHNRELRAFKDRENGSKRESKELSSLYEDILMLTSAPDIPHQVLADKNENDPVAKHVCHLSVTGNC